MADRCDGMFLWLDLISKDLRESQTKLRLKDIVENAPSLHAAYERNWRRIPDQCDYDKSRGLKILQWCVFSIRPLTVSELAEVLAIQSLEEQDELNPDDLPGSINDEYIDAEIKERCGSLVEVKSLNTADPPGQRIVQLVHL